MKKRYIFILFVFLPLFILGQRDSLVDIGIYYTAVADYEQRTTSGATYTMWERYLDVSVRYKLAKSWRIGMEFIGVIVKGEGIKNPFFLTNTFVDYDIFRSKKMSLNIRGGVGFGNILFAGDEEPTKRLTVNRTIGISYEYRAYRNFWIHTGYFNHFPLNNIKFKYGIAQPFVGVLFKF